MPRVPLTPPREAKDRRVPLHPATDRALPVAAPMHPLLTDHEVEINVPHLTTGPARRAPTANSPGNAPPAESPVSYPSRAGRKATETNRARSPIPSPAEPSRNARPPPSPRCMECHRRSPVAPSKPTGGEATAARQPGRRTMKIRLHRLSSHASKQLENITYNPSTAPRKTASLPSRSTLRPCAASRSVRTKSFRPQITLRNRNIFARRGIPGRCSAPFRSPAVRPRPGRTVREAPIAVEAVTALRRLRTVQPGLDKTQPALQ